MLYAQDDERDEDREDDDDDADDIEEDDNSDDEEEDDDAEDDEDEDSDDDSEDDEEDEDDNKPITRKELREMLRKNGNKQNANRRISSKDRNRNDRKDPKDRRERGDQRNIRRESPKTDERLSSLEKAHKKAELVEKKRDFGHRNNLSPEQTDIVFRMTKRPTKKFLETPYVKAALDAVRSNSNVRDNTPRGSGRGSFKSNTGRSWEKMDDKEKQDSFADRRRAILANKRG